MKIKRDKDKKELTPEEKELKDLKRAKNIGLAALGTGAVSMLASRAGRKTPRDYDGKPKNIKVLKYGGEGLGIIGAGLHGISAVKYNKLKKKLKKQQEEEKNDNPEKSKK